LVEEISQIHEKEDNEIATEKDQIVVQETENLIETTNIEEIQA
jgi:hypothetical protein